MDQSFCMTSDKTNLVCLANNPNLAVATLTGIRSETPRIMNINAGFINMTGYSLMDMESELGGIVWNLLREADRDYLKHTYRMKFSKNTGYQCSYQLIRKDKNIVYVQDNGYFFENEEGEACAQMILTDVTGMQTSKQEMRECKYRLEMGLRSSNSCVFEVDLRKQLHTYFKNAAGLFGISDEQILEDVRAFSRLDSEEFREAVAEYFAHPDDQGLILEAYERVFDGVPASCEARMRVGGSRYVWCRVNLTPVMEDGIPDRMIGIVTNINQIKVRADKYKRKAARDLFTGLYNKQHAELLIRSVLNSEPDKNHAFMLMDIDKLKQINDTFGHGFGDEVIKDVSQQLKKVFRKSDVLGRFGGDEFIVFMKDISDRSVIEARMREVMECAGTNSVTKSIGISVFPKDGEDFDTLLQCADLALYESKKYRNTYTFFKERPKVQK